MNTTTVRPSPEEFEARLRERSEASWARWGNMAPERVAYRKAAALVWQFDPRTLQLPERACIATAARVVVEGSTDDPAIQNAIARLRERLEADDTFGETHLQMHPDEDISVVDVALPGDPNYETAEDALRVLRSDYVPAAFEGADAEVHVTASGAVSRLLEDCIARSDREGLRWRLLPKVRDTALASFKGPEEARRFLEANLARCKPDSTAVLAAALLDGDPPDVNSLDLRTLGRLREAVTWLSRVPGVTGLIQVQEIDGVLERSRLEEPMRALLRRPFEGRVAELNRLREHIGLLPPLTSGGTLSPTDSLGIEPPGPQPGQHVLVVHGPAGVGKSTLLAKTLMDHLTNDSIGELPFVYIDAERATISLNEPLSLVAEMARQLAVQYPTQALPFTDLSAQAQVKAKKQRLLTEDLEDLREVATAKTISRSGLSEYHASARDEESGAAYQLGTILGQAVRTSPPFVVVLDSFEEAQYRASPALDRMWSMWSALRKAYPPTRVIVVGRAPVGHPNIPADEVATVELGELDLTAAVHFLGGSGIGPTLAQAITTRIGGNPLSLQLAARVAEASREAHEDDDWILQVPVRRHSFFRTVDDMLIQGMLYDRLLKHITNPSVRKLAHPSLVMRRITPDLIRAVLAPQCGVDVPDDATAWGLFDELASELDLVERVAPPVLRHRSDMRRIMLRLLSTDDKRTVQAVERAAVMFYQDSDDPEDRAEELYHRLRLAENLNEVKARWTPAAAAALADAEPELPARSARLLGRLMRGSRELPSTNAEQITWEQRTADEVEDLLIQGLEEEAKALLRQRMPWTPCSPLHGLEVEVHLRLGELDDARRAVNAALDGDQTKQCDEVRLELLLLSARVHARSGDLVSANADLDRAEQTASSLGRDLDALGALLMRVRLREQAGPDSRQAAAEDLIGRVQSTDDAVLATRPALFRAIAAEVGPDAPEILAQAVTQVGLPPLTGPAVADLAGAVAEALDEPEVAKVVGLADEDRKQSADPPIEQVAQLLKSADSNGRLDEVAQDLLATPDDTGALTQGIAAAMAEGTEGPNV